MTIRLWTLMLAGLSPEADAAFLDALVPVAVTPRTVTVCAL